MLIVYYIIGIIDLLVDGYHDQVSLHRLEIELQLEIKTRHYFLVYEQYTYELRIFHFNS